MPRTIWKFTLAPTDEQTIDIPSGARLIAAREQGDDVCVWAEVDPGAPTDPRTFRVAGTGHPLPDRPMTHVGTAMPHGGDLVFHVYELAA